MVGNDKYRERLNDLREKMGRSHTRSVYRSVSKLHPDEHISDAERKLKSYNPPSDKLSYDMAFATAYRLMKSNDIQEVIVGAQLYEKYGRGEKVIPRLLKALEKQKGCPGWIYDMAGDFIERNSEKSKTKDLTQKLSIFLGLLAGGFGIGLVSLKSSFTGNVVGGSNAFSASSIGVILVIAGLIGAFFYFKKR